MLLSTCEYASNLALERLRQLQASLDCTAVWKQSAYVVLIRLNFNPSPPQSESDQLRNNTPPLSHTHTLYV